MVPGVKDVVIKTASGISEVDIELVENATNEVRANITMTMAKSGWPVLEFRSLDPSLEEVFLSVTSG